MDLFVPPQKQHRIQTGYLKSIFKITETSALRGHSDKVKVIRLKSSIHGRLKITINEGDAVDRKGREDWVMQLVVMQQAGLACKGMTSKL